MWIVKVALERPYTFIVLAFLILLLSPVVILWTRPAIADDSWAGAPGQHAVATIWM